jgi:hypothetical protein
MSVPWMRVLDLALGVTNWSRDRARGRRPAEGALGRAGLLEARIAGVIAGALGEVFSRDHTREQEERERAEAQRREEARMRRLFLMREIGDREIGRLRLIAGLALAGWVGSLIVAVTLPGASLAIRVLVAIAWLFLLVALTVALSAQARLADALARLADPDTRQPDSGAAGTAAVWLLIAGLVLIAAAALAGAASA